MFGLILSVLTVLMRVSVGEINYIQPISQHVLVILVSGNEKLVLLKPYQYQINITNSPAKSTKQEMTEAELVYFNNI